MQGSVWPVPLRDREARALVLRRWRRSLHRMVRSRFLLGVALVNLFAACAPEAATSPRVPTGAQPIASASVAPAPSEASPPVAPAPALAASTPSPTASLSPPGSAPGAAVPSPAPRPSVPPALADALDAAEKAIAAGDGAASDKHLAAADAIAGDDAHLAYLVARVRAARFAHTGDFEHAASALVAVIPALAQHPDLPDEFWAHNAMMMIREAQGDPASALAEDDQATLCAARGTWDPQGRDTLAFQKDRWHRAYLTRMLAESRAGSAKRALIAYAQAALDEYRPRGFPESVAVLEAYFAALDGRREAALAAARQIDPAKDDDVEDLYLVVVGLEAGGDHAGAEAVRRVMRGTAGVRISRAIMLRWLDLDASAPRARGFTPWHAAR
jgi:hypothetical protein